LIETFFLGFAMLERPGLEMWYNFILLYPLAKVFNKPRTEKFLELDESDESDAGTKITEYEKEYKAFMGLKAFPPYKVEERECGVEVSRNYRWRSFWNHILIGVRHKVLAVLFIDAWIEYIIESTRVKMSGQKIEYLP
jgi:hypothetical protein